MGLPDSKENTSASILMRVNMHSDFWILYVLVKLGISRFPLLHSNSDLFVFTLRVSFQWDSVELWQKFKEQNSRSKERIPPSVFPKIL